MPQKTPFNRNVSFSRAKNLPSIATVIFDEEKHALQSKWQFLPARFFFLSNRSEAPSRYNHIIRISVVQPMNSRAWWPSRCSHGSGDNLRSLVTIYVLYSFYCFIRISAVQPMFNHMLGGPLDVCMLAVTFFTILYSLLFFLLLYSDIGCATNEFTCLVAVSMFAC